MKITINELKQEITLEEVMINNGYHDRKSDDLWREGVEFGAKWHQERMYSDMEEYGDYCLMCSAEKTLKMPLSPKEWFDQFKKK